MKICHGCSTQLANAVKTCKTCGATFGKPREENEKAKRPGGVKGGEPLTIFIDENDKTGAKSVTLKALGLTVAGFEDDAKVQFLVEDPKGKKIRRVTHAFVGEKVLPLKNCVYTSTVHGHANAIRGWMVDLSARDWRKKEKIWLVGNYDGGKCGVELRSDIEDHDEKSAFEKAKELVRGSIHAPRVKVDCARVMCPISNVDGQLRCDFTGEGDDALEDATAKAGWQLLCNAVTYLINMETHPLFLALSDDLRRDALLAKEGKRFDHATFQGHGHATTAVPLGTRVVRTKKGDKWEYIDASGVYRKAADRADAEKKALRNPRIREVVRRMDELEKNLRAYDVKYGNTTDGLLAACLPQFFQNRDNRDGRGFNSKMFDVDAVWKFGGLRDVYAVSATPVSRGGRHVAGVRSTQLLLTFDILAGPLRSSRDL